MAKNNLFGFTIIEVVIAVTIIGILSTLGISSYVTFNQTKTLEHESYKMVEALELGKKRALSGEKICGTYAGTYTFDWTTTSYSLSPNGCSQLFSYLFPAVIQASSSGSVTFQPFGLGTGSSTCIMLHHEISDKCRKITLNAAGTVSEQRESDCSCP